ncbi:MAG: protease pro-enzyme activation domain-containing protein [Steroidobacteraceae bacterium]
MSFSKYLLAAVCALSVAGAAHAAPYPRAGLAPDTVDLGRTDAVAADQQISVTVSLRLSNSEQLEPLLQSIYAQGSPQFHRFLSTQEFQQRFAPSAATIAAVTQHLQAAGLTVTRSATAHLKASGSPAAIERAFGVQLHSYQVPAIADAPGYGYHAPLSEPQLPATVAGSVRGIYGLDSRPRFFPHSHRATHPPLHKGGGQPNTPDPPGLWTVTDYAIWYDVNPLYQRGIDGRGRTIGIISLAAFTPSDAIAYWNSLGLKFDPNRINVVNVDGGPGPVCDDCGSGETTLDVEQSGGIAPGADMQVYLAPNTNQAFIDVFAQAIDDNLADTVSTSWGEWELFDSNNPFGNGPIGNPVTGTMTSTLTALDDLLLQAALQGQSFFAAAGDNGAYDEQNELPPNYTQVLSVDDPATQRFITAAGGTTLPGVQTFTDPPGFSVDIATEQAWTWDYLIPLCDALGLDPLGALCGIYPVGTGGGISVYVPQPFYQQGIPGMLRTQPHQNLIDESQTPPALIAALPAGFDGRNLPDLSVNADPDTGYTIWYTSSSSGFSVLTYIGGTSFSSPQLNGTTALLAQGVHHRIGLLNVPLYQLLRQGNAYNEPNAPLRDIREGDNWYFYAHKGYDQTTGVGVPDVANLLEALRNLGY